MEVHRVDEAGAYSSSNAMIGRAIPSKSALCFMP